MKRYFREQKKLFFVGFSFYIIAFLFKTSSYFAQMETMGSAIAQDLPRLLFFVALQYGALILFHILHMTHEFFMQKAFANAKTSMRNTISQRVTEKNYQEFRSMQIGDYISWYTNDVAQMNDGLQIFIALITYTMELIVSVAAIAYIHWSLAVLAVVTSSLVSRALCSEKSGCRDHKHKSAWTVTKYYPDVPAGGLGDHTTSDCFWRRQSCQHGK